ncbi:MAG TPA: FAD-binding oxidoreductase [Candidatus Limnocylindrales bacterium]|nr:FAD-binding oxidoreductase [Candidatus Limnocylindrales bacterium]
MTGTADVIVVGAGVQGASLAFHLARRGASVLVLERDVVGAGATGRSSGFVRMHYDLESDARLAWASFPYFRAWKDVVGAGDCEFVRTGFLQLMPPPLADRLRANVAMHQRIGIPTRVVGPEDVAELVPGSVTDDIGAGAYEPESGYADPSGTAAGFLAAAREDGARLIQGCVVHGVATEGDRVVGVDTDRGRFVAPVVVDAAGAWAAQLARTVGVAVPVEPWRHDTAFFGLPPGREAGFPIVIDEGNQVYFRPEGRELVLVGLETGNEVGGSPDRPLGPVRATIIEAMITRACARVPWLADGTLRADHGGQDGITTADQRPILGRAGPDGFYLACGFSGTGFKTAPAVGACLAELILDGRATTVDISTYGLARFAEGRLLVGEHAYGNLWR